jgi:polyisoprenoid-binding protein YceI
MAKWVFEPGHTAAEFCTRHMMVTWIRGCFKNIEGTMEFDPADPVNSSVEVEINAASLWSGDPDRDDHLRHSDFLDTENYPKITFKGNEVQLMSHHDFKVTGDLTIRGVTHKVTLDVRYLGQWDTPFWEDGVDKGPMARAGFVAETTINRHDFGVTWNATMDRGGVVVGEDVLITIDVEALLQP